MNYLETFEVVNPQGKEDTCAKFSIDDTITPFTLHDIAEVNQEYVLSFWVKSDAKGKLTACGESITTSNAWEHHSIVFTATQTDVSYHFNQAGTYYVYQSKLEKGNIATDWTCAPEDQDAVFEEMDKRVDSAAQTATDYLAFDFDSSGVIVGDMTEATLGQNVLIHPRGVDIRNNTESLATFSSDQLRLGAENSDNLLLDDGLFIRQGSNVLASFAEDKIHLGKNSDYVSILFGNSLGKIGSGGIWHNDDYLGQYMYLEATNHLSLRGSYVELWPKSELSGGASFAVGREWYQGDWEGAMIRFYLYDDDPTIRCDGEILQNSYDLTFKGTQGYYSRYKGNTNKCEFNFYKNSEFTMHKMSKDETKFDFDNVCHVFTKASVSLGTLTYVNGALRATNSLYMGDGGSATDGRGLYVPYLDAEEHAIVYRGSDGLTSYFGWAGSDSYKSIAVVRGKECRLQSTTGTTITSDERLKEDFADLEAWDDFYDALQPCAFKLKTGSSGRYHMGFKAQQVEQALLDAGLTTKDFAGFIKSKYIIDEEDPERSKVYAKAGINEGDDEYGLIYSEFTALNTYQIQQLKKEVTELKRLVDQLLPI